VQVTDALSRGTDVVFRVDIQGAQTVRRVFPDAVSLFLVGKINLLLVITVPQIEGTHIDICTADMSSGVQCAQPIVNLAPHLLNTLL